MSMIQELDLCQATNMLGSFSQEKLDKKDEGNKSPPKHNTLTVLAKLTETPKLVMFNCS